MRVVLTLAIAFMLTTGAEAAPAAKAEEARLVEVETSMWKMWKTRDAASFEKLLAEDFYDIYLSGEVVGRKELMKGFLSAELLDYQLGPMSVVRLSKESVLLTYRAHVHGRGRTEVTYDVDVTSAWAIRKGEWKSVFYRENLVPERLPWSSSTP